MGKTYDFNLDTDGNIMIGYDDEIWRPIVLDKGRPDCSALYEVSSFGRVRSIKKNKILKPFGSNKENRKHQRWQRVALTYPKSERSKHKHHEFKMSVHRLVALAFLGYPPDETYQVNHKDGNPENNNISNLEWCTMSHNMQHAYKTGLVHTPRGSRRSNAIFDEDDVRAIAWLMSKGYKAKDINKIIFNLGMTYNSNITRPRINHLMKHLRGGTHWKAIAKYYKII